MKSIVCIPTYNESDNILRIIDAIHDVVADLHVLVIDDGSPDGTADLVRRRMTTDERIYLIERSGKLGLGTAYCAGFAEALKLGYDRILQMDADFSHDPKELPRFLEAAESYDLIIGSRYVSGVNVINWPMSRLLLSWFANLYTRTITRMPIADATGGFKCFRSDVLSKIDLTAIRSNGYAFQIEMNYRAWRLGARIKELPIIFVDRVSGESKMSKNIVYEAAWLVWKMKLITIITFGKR
ncbi:MAG TPA: dolichyl-phosphate beta-D-mannosyltransferase [Bacteroidetes bacterium]|nr:dolichyl-phosphate beta-D-mannosyltransferase [Bacteroidota bacterium]HRK03876.1 polyprenol monophosphomannose synthase [Chlorobiota bacterium]